MTLVYLIEDDPTMANVLSLSIRQAGQLQPDGTIAVPRVEIFHDAVSAIQAVNEQVPDVILLDILLTGPNGFTFLNELRSYSDTVNTPVILISSLDLTNERLAPYGITKVLDKATMTPEDIQLAIAEALAKTAIAALERQTVAPAPESQPVIPEAEVVDPTRLPAVAPTVDQPTVPAAETPVVSPVEPPAVENNNSPAENTSSISKLNQLLASDAGSDALAQNSSPQDPNAL